MLYSIQPKLAFRPKIQNPASKIFSSGKIDCKIFVLKKHLKFFFGFELCGNRWYSVTVTGGVYTIQPELVWDPKIQKPGSKIFSSGKIDCKIFVLEKYLNSFLFFNFAATVGIL